MKLKTKTLKKALTFAIKTAPRSGHVLQRNARVSADGANFIIETNSFQTSTVVTFPCEEKLSPAVVDARVLKSMLTGSTVELEKGAVSLMVDGVSVPLFSDWIGLEHTVATEGNAGITIPGIIDALAFCLPYVSTDETRYNMNGICIDSKGFTATDTHKLAHAPCSHPGNLEAIGGHVILPTETANQMIAAAKLTGNEIPVSTYFGNGLLTEFSHEGGAFGARVFGLYVEGRFPNYQQVIPQKNTLLVPFEKAPLVEAVQKRLALREQYNAGKKPKDRHRTAALVFKLNGKSVTLEGADGPTERAQEAAGVEFARFNVATGLGDKQKTAAFNADYLKTLLSSFLEETVNFRFDSNEPDVCPALVDANGTDRIVLVMPMRV